MKYINNANHYYNIKICRCQDLIFFAPNTQAILAFYGNLSAARVNCYTVAISSSETSLIRPHLFPDKRRDPDI